MKPTSIHCRPGTTEAMERLAAENEALRVERDGLKACLQWRDNETDPITNQHRGKVLLICLADSFDGISHTDELSGNDCTIDLTWIRSDSEVFATTGTYKNDDILAWAEIPNVNPAKGLAHIKAQGAREALQRAMQKPNFSDTVVRVDLMREIIEKMEAGK